MKVVIQRVSQASVSVDGEQIASIEKGILILVGIKEQDSQYEIDYLVKKIISLRIFDDSEGVMNLSLNDTKGDILVVSQFTLMARTKKGNRPSYIDAAKGNISGPIYERFCECLEKSYGKKVKRGCFGADMKVALINDGPVTIIIDTDENLPQRV